MNELTNEKTMTVKEVADSLSVSRQLVSEWVKKLYPEIVKNGIETRLNIFQITEVKNNIIKNPFSPSTIVEAITEVDEYNIIIKAHEILQRKVLELKQQNEIANSKLIEQKPKVELYESFIEINDLHSIGEVSKLLKIGRNTLFKKLRELKILMTGNIPYQKYIDLGYFQVKISPNENIDLNIPVTFATPKGIEFINKKINNTL
jgi:phage antirepressor YoqD-like protein/predicted DNA-binding protein YlxM (UPF0122 family)